MSFLVIWETYPTNVLAQIWLDAPDRRLIMQAQAVVDQILATNPKTGAHISEGLWAIERYPLRVFYEIDEAKHLVLVTSLGQLA